MSADNGLILWREGEDYVLSEYSASHDWEDEASLPRRIQDRRLERVLFRAQEIMRAEIIEYGLSLSLPADTDEESDQTGDDELVALETGVRSRPSALAG